MFPKRRLIVLTVVISAFATVLAPSAQADWPATTCVDGSTPIGNSSFVSGGTANVTLSVGGVTQNNVTQTYIAEVCKDSGSGLYNYMVGLKTGSTISESGNSAPSTYRNGTDTIILSFTLSNGDVPKMVEGYGNISDFAISGQRVTITGTPGALTQINYGGSSPYIACQSAPYTGTYGGGQSCAAIPCYDPATLTGDSNCVDDLATFHGAVRGPNGGVDKTGMWISSAANLYAVGLNNCASLKTRARHGHRVTRDDGGANRPSPDISVQMVGPHYKTDGSLNTGNIHAFIPFAVIQNCFGTDTASFAQSVGVTRQEGGADTALVSGAGFTATPTVGGPLPPVFSFEVTEATHGPGLSPLTVHVTFFAVILHDPVFDLPLRVALIAYDFTVVPGAKLAIALPFAPFHETPAILGVEPVDADEPVEPAPPLEVPPDDAARGPAILYVGLEKPTVGTVIRSPPTVGVAVKPAPDTSAVSAPPS